MFQLSISTTAPLGKDTIEHRCREGFMVPGSVMALQLVRQFHGHCRRRCSRRVTFINSAPYPEPNTARLTTRPRDSQATTQPYLKIRASDLGAAVQLRLKLPSNSDAL